jgi:phospholipid/cholesterol/gamma-HCH transport system substrate-binding protein
VARQQVARLVALLALAIAVVAVGVVLVTGGSSYVVHARFYDAGQLVNGDLVTVGGHQVGSIGSIKLSPDGFADVELHISDESITPIHAGTIATIGQLSLTGVANRFVGLQLSGAGPVIHDGGALPFTQTRGIVDLDTLLDSLTPRVRAQIDELIKTGAYFVKHPTAAQLNQFELYLNPAFSQSTQLISQVLSDKFSLDRLLASTAQIATALAAHNADLSGAVTNTAAVLREIAGQRTVLQDTLVRAPGVLHQATGVLTDVNFTLGKLNPVLTDVQPVAPHLATLLRKVVPVAHDAIPTIQGVQALIPGAEAALQGLPPVLAKATPAVRSLTEALKGILPILAGLRPYGPDAVAGFFNGVGGASGGGYDANGHYLKALLTVQAGGDTLTGLLNFLGSLVGKTTGAVVGLKGRTGLLAPCPGGGNAPAWDNSNPWNNPDIPKSTGNLCNPANNQKP